MKYLVTGGAGFVGSNIVARLLQIGEKAVVFDNLSRVGTTENLEWLKTMGRFEFVKGDTRDADATRDLIIRTQPDVIFHLAGQVAMTTSMSDPRKDFEINVVGSINVLEAVRNHAPDSVIIYSSSNKAYGDLSVVRLVELEKRYTAPDFPTGINETAPLDFHTPYGCSKGAADQYMLDYARSFGIRATVFRHSTIFGGRQHSTYDQGWVGWFCRQALETKRFSEREPFTISGDGKQVRDLLFVEDAVDCYLAAAARIDQARGQAFNIGGGVENSSSLLELFDFLESELGVQLNYTRLPWRHDDQRYFVADNSKASQLIGWTPLVSKVAGIRRTLDWTVGLLN